MILQLTFCSFFLLNLIYREEVVSSTDLEAAIYNNDTQLDAAVIESLLLGAYRVKDRAELEGCSAKAAPAIRDYLMSRHIKPIVTIHS